jgi:hypothetical protein
MQLWIIAPTNIRRRIFVRGYLPDGATESGHELSSSFPAQTRRVCAEGASQRVRAKRDPMTGSASEPGIHNHARACGLPHSRNLDAQVAQGPRARRMDSGPGPSGHPGMTREEMHRPAKRNAPWGEGRFRRVTWVLGGRLLARTFPGDGERSGSRYRTIV